MNYQVVVSSSSSSLVVFVVGVDIDVCMRVAEIEWFLLFSTDHWCGSIVNYAILKIETNKGKKYSSSGTLFEDI